MEGSGVGGRIGVQKANKVRAIGRVRGWQKRWERSGSGRLLDGEGCMARGMVCVCRALAEKRAEPSGSGGVKGKGAAEQRGPSAAVCGGVQCSNIPSPRKPGKEVETLLI